MIIFTRLKYALENRLPPALVIPLSRNVLRFKVRWCAKCLYSLYPGFDIIFKYHFRKKINCVLEGRSNKKKHFIAFVTNTIGRSVISKIEFQQSDSLAYATTEYADDNATNR